MRKIISIILSFGLLFQQSGLLYAVGELNLANYLSQAKSAIVQPDQFRPAQLRYISYDIKSNDFKLLLDKGGAKLNELSSSLNFSTPKLNDATQELFNYFLIGLSLPNDTFWVNLRPDAPENIIDPILEKTDIGKIFLEADLQLKKDTASFTSPQNPEGKLYWDKLYKKAGELFGTENITIPTITRPWIVPNEVIVRETEDSAYIYKATLKVMLEEDYLRGMKDAPAGASGRGTIDYSFSDPRLKELNQYSTQLIRETIIPKLTKEINSSKRYAKLRQVYYSLVLARWFKQKYGLGSRVSSQQDKIKSYVKLIDSGDLTNLTSQEPCDKQTYFQAYQKSFKDGEYNLKEAVATPFGQSIRSYISGGIVVKYNTTGFTTPENKEVIDTLTGQRSAIVNSPVVGENYDKDKYKWPEKEKIEDFKRRLNEMRDEPVLLKKTTKPPKDNIPPQKSGSPLEEINKRIKELESNIAERRNRITQIQDDISVNQKNIDDIRSQALSASKFQLSELGKEEWELQDQNDRNYAAISRIREHISKMSLELLKLREEAAKAAGSPLTVEQEKLINEIMVATSGREFKSVPEEILYRIESIIKEIGYLEVKIKAGDRAKPIKSLIREAFFDSLDWLDFIASLEKYSGVELLENREDIEIKLRKSVNEIVKDLRGRMSDANGGEFKGLLKLICRAGVDDLLKKVHWGVPESFSEFDLKRAA